MEERKGEYNSTRDPLQWDNFQAFVVYDLQVRPHHLKLKDCKTFFYCKMQQLMQGEKVVIVGNSDVEEFYKT